MYYALVIVHILAAISWVGGMIFLSLVLAPLVRSRKAVPEFMALFRSAALRFRPIVWVAMAILVMTGPMLLSLRGIAVATPSSWPGIVMAKLTLVALLLVLTLLHDLVLGPQVSRVSAIPESQRTAGEQVVFKTARWLPRLSLLIALAVVITAVMLARW
ncbi:MAG: CopD family protein [Nitrospira sp.]|nr:CopD family protein [Nitrospira sp.]MDH4305695.1 CopD family protein [Nitrospira sp.]MDH5193690.1 CopD family protein [Nitrospira sp.]